MNGNDRRVIEDYIPLKALSEEGGREKGVRKGHLSSIHLWWARRPLSLSRAAIYGSLIPAPECKNGRGGGSRFVAELCRYPGEPGKIAAAEEQILEAHAQRLGASIHDIREGRAPRPRVLDPFAGGGSIPLEAARLGCEAHALELNPIAHLVELVTLVYARCCGRALAEELERWGKEIEQRVRDEIGDLYPALADKGGTGRNPKQLRIGGGADVVDAGSLVPTAYLWSRTVRCKRPDCQGDVPLVRQTWLCQKKGRMVALRPGVDVRSKTIHYHVAEARTESALGFDPERGQPAAMQHACSAEPSPMKSTLRSRDALDV